MKNAGSVLLALLLLAANTVGAAAHGYKKKGIEIFHPWIAETAGPQGFVSMRIRNKGDVADRLIEARSPMAAKVELARSGTGGGIEVPAGGEVELSAKGAHLAIDGLNRPLRAYDRLPLVLSFEKAGMIEVEAMVEETP